MLGLTFISKELIFGQAYFTNKNKKIPKKRRYFVHNFYANTANNIYYHKNKVGMKL
jgi:hypothetical protein